MNKILSCVLVLEMSFSEVIGLNVGRQILGENNNSVSSVVSEQREVSPVIEEGSRDNAEVREMPVEASRVLQTTRQAEQAFSNEVSAISGGISNYFARIWGNVTPVLRCPIEFCVYGFRYIYSRNRTEALVAFLSVSGVTAFAVWMEYRCLSLYDSLFCNPFASPSLKHQVARFFGL